MRRLKVLFLCTHNSCRSQMAEGWARYLKGEVIEAFSAGTAPRAPDPLAVKVMAEAGVDISAQKSKSLAEFRDATFDYVVTLCDGAREACPLWVQGGRVAHVGFDDPSYLAACDKKGGDALVHYRRVRDEIKAFVLRLPDALEQKKS